MLKVSCLVSKVLHTRIHCHLCFLSLWILKNILKTLLCLIRHESLKVAAAQSLILTKLLQSGCIDVGSCTNFFETVLHFCLSSCDGEMERWRPPRCLETVKRTLAQLLCPPTLNKTQRSLDAFDRWHSQKSALIIDLYFAYTSLRRSVFCNLS